MNDPRRCEFCRFFDTGYLECRKKPPIHISFIGETGSDSARTFPPVSPKDWCGEFEEWAKNKSDEDLRELEIRTGLNTINIELCALLPDPKNPNWMIALNNNNPADAESLQMVFNIVHKLLNLFAD